MRFAACLLVSIALAAQTRPGMAAQKRRPAAAKPKPAATEPSLKPPAPGEVPELKEFPIATLRVEGNSVYSEASILKLSGLKPGDLTSKPVFEAARDRILASGAFDSVGYHYFTASDGKSYEAVFQIVEAIPRYPFRAEDLPLSPDEVTALLRARDPLYGPKIPATKAKIDIYKSIIEEAARKKGFNGSVIGKVEADSPDALAILFRPAGATPSIADVRLTGFQVIPLAALKPAINGIAVGVPYQEQRFRQLLDTSIRPLYEARGRLAVKFTELKVERSNEVNGLNITVTIDEGPAYQLGNVRLSGRGFDEAELTRAADLRPGDIANMSAVAEGIERMRLALRRKGHIMAVATLERQPNHEKKILDAIVDIDPGPQYAFRTLKIQGLDIESEPVIRKMWGLPSGKPYNPDYPDIFLKRVRTDGIFDNLGETKWVPEIDEKSQSVDVTLLFGSAAKSKSILKSDGIGRP